MECIGCGSRAVAERSDRTARCYRRFRCRDCRKQFNELSAGLPNRAQYPSDVIALVVFFRLRYKLSLRDLAEMFLLRGIEFSHETVRQWEALLTPALISALRRRRIGGTRAGRSWYTDETYIKVRGRWHYLYRAIDRAGNLVDVMLSQKRDMAAAIAFFPVSEGGDGSDTVAGDHGWSRQLSASDPDDVGRERTSSNEPLSEQSN
jgi:putative transposase